MQLQQVEHARVDLELAGGPGRRHGEASFDQRDEVVTARRQLDLTVSALGRRELAQGSLVVEGAEEDDVEISDAARDGALDGVLAAYVGIDFGEAFEEGLDGLFDRLQRRHPTPFRTAPAARGASSDATRTVITEPGRLAVPAAVWRPLVRDALKSYLALAGG